VFYIGKVAYEVSMLSVCSPFQLLNQLIDVRVEVFMVVKIEVDVFWVVIHCSVVVHLKAVDRFSRSLV